MYLTSLRIFQSYLCGGILEESPAAHTILAYILLQRQRQARICPLHSPLAFTLLNLIIAINRLSCQGWASRRKTIAKSDRPTASSRRRPEARPRELLRLLRMTLRLLRRAPLFPEKPDYRFPGNDFPGNDGMGQDYPGGGHRQRRFCDCPGFYSAMRCARPTSGLY